MSNITLARLRRLSRWLERVTSFGILLIAALAVAGFFVPEWTRSVMLNKLGQTGAALPLTEQTRIGVAAIACVPIAVMLYGLWQVRGLFAEFARGDLFNTCAARRLELFGFSVLAQGPLGPLTATAIALAASLANPPGQRLLVLTFSINDYFALIVGGALVAAARVMREAASLAEENASFV